MADLIIAVGVVVFLFIPCGALALVFALSNLRDEFGIDPIKRFRKKKEDE